MGKCVRLWAVVVLLLWTFPSVTKADVNTGTEWLSSTAQSSGAYAQPNDISTQFQATAEALRTFNALGVNANGTSAALQYLVAEPYRNTENLSRLIIAGIQNGQNVSALLTQLVASQDNSGGFAELPGYQPTVLDTAFALEALALSGNLNSQAAGYAVGFLQQQQAADGSWTDGDNAPSVYLSALSLASLQQYASVYNLSATLQAGSNFLLSARQGDGLWGQDYLSGEGLIALLQILSDTTPIQAGISTLASHQSSDGSWADDTFSTSVVLRALGLAQGRGGASNGTGAVQGYVTQAGSSQPIGGATVAVSSIQGVSTQTNAAGFFSLSGLPSGNLTLVANKAGFSSTSAVVKIVTGQTVTASGLVLSPGAQSGTLRVHVVDSSTGAVLAGATVAINGSGGVASGTTDNSGNVEFDAVAPGTVSVSIQANGYQAVQATATVSGGQILTFNQPLQSSTAGGGSGPSILTGTVIDAVSSTPVSGAVFAISNGPSATTAASGAFSLGSLNGGSYTATISAAGYATQTISIQVPSGVTASLGTITLYQSNNTSAPNTVILVGTVIDGLTNKAVAGVTINVANSSLSATSDGQGNFTIANIPNLSFQLQLAAPGYTSTSYSVTASAYGSVSGTFALPQVGAGGNTTNLQGHVTDASSGTAITGATVQVGGTSTSVQTDSAGAYQLSNLSGTQFQVQVSALNYTTQNLNVQLSGPGTYTLNAQLVATDSSASSGFQVLSLTANNSGLGAFQTQIFTAQVGNQAGSSQEGVLIGRILDAGGKQVAKTIPYAPGTQTSQSDFTFAAQEVKTLQVPWDPAQLPPGTYTMELDVVKAGTLSAKNPTGTILAANTAFTTVSATQSFIGTLAFNPPAAQAGSGAPVALDVLIINNGNVPLEGTPLTLKILSADGSSVLDATSTTLPQPLPVAQFVYVPFGSWVPTASGNLPANVSSNGSGVRGQVTGTFYVGDKPAGSFTVAPTDVYVGNQTVQATVDVTGIDKAITAEGPIVTAIRNAVQHGSAYVATNVVNDQRTNRCLRCHVQTQSYYGLASLLSHDVGSDQDSTQFLYNDLSTSQRDNGIIQNAQDGNPETETALALWALTQAPDKLDSFRTKYKAALYMHLRAVQSGGKTYWNPDYSFNTWWQNVDSHNMMAAKGFVDLLQTARNNSLAGILDYSASAPVALGGGVNGLRPGPDGALYAVLYAQGTIVRYDPVAGAVSTVVTGLPTNGPTYCSSPLVISPNEFYVPCQNQLVHVLPDGTMQTAATLSGGGDIAMDGNGTIYVSDYTSNRILRGQVGGTFSVWVSGGNLSNPFGLAVGADGNLYVANYGGFNILKIDASANVTLFADGLSFRPLYLTSRSDGSFYASFPSSNDSDGSGFRPDSLLTISSTGIAKSVLGVTGLRGVAMLGQQLYMAGYDGNLHALVTAPLDVGQLPTLAADVTGIANYYLAEYNDAAVYNTWQAVRLIGLSEVRRYITDPALDSQIDQAIAAINTLLRFRQRTDGGWGFTQSYSSDAMVTALVGTALDYVPPANDSVVLNAVQYLLNNQAADGSWYSANGIMSTRFAATSLVMAYLPRVLDRIGGLNVELHLQFPTNIALNTPSVPQNGDVTNSDGTSDWTWDFNGVTSSGRTLNFNLALANLLPGEKRPAASAAYLLSTNSFDGSQVRVDLPIPTINASDEMALTSVGTDAGTYPANSPVQITGAVHNSAPVAQSGSVIFTIKAADGSVVTTLPAVPFSNLASNASTSVSTTWNSGTTLSGTYPVVGDLYDSSGTFINELATSLTIATTGTGGGTGSGPNTEVTLRVTTDKQTYSTTDQVNIGDLVHNISVNGTVGSATQPTNLKLTVTDPNGAQVLNVTVPLGQLTPGYLRQLSNLYGLKAAPTGNYVVSGAVLDYTGAILATGSASFKVIEDQSRTIAGTESVSQPTVYQGDPLICNDAVINRGTLAASNLLVRQLIINLDTGTVDQQADTVANLAAGATQTYVRNFTTGGLAIGNHACAIQAQVDGAYKTLASASFVVQQPPVRVSGTLTLGDKGRLLVLMDSPTDHGPPLCNTGLVDISLEAGINQNLSPNAVVEVKVLNILGLVVDTETISLRSFTGEVNANVGHSGIDLAIPSFTADSLVVKLVGTGVGNLLSGTYRVVATITDQTNLQYLTFDSGLVSLTCNVLGSVGSILNNTFTLIGLNDTISNAGTGIGDGADTKSIAQQKSTLQTLLSQDGWSYDIVMNKNDFATRFRTGSYQDYALLSEYQVLDPQVQEELREHVYNGEGLLVAGRHDVRTRILDNPLGVDYRGTQLLPTGLQMVTGNVLGLNGQVSFTQSNNVQRLVLTGAVVDGNVLSGIPTAQTSLVVHNLYGNGKSAMGGYDMLAEASAEATPNLYSSLIRKPLTYVNPLQGVPLVGRVIPLHLTISNSGIANTTQATVTTSLNGYVVAASAGTVANGKLLWSTPLAAGQSLGVDLWVQVSSDGSPVTITATLIASTSSFTAKAVVSNQVISPVLKPSLNKAITDLTTYVANQPPPGLLGAILDPLLGLKTPAAAALDGLKRAQSDLNGGNAAAALSEMVRATSYLINDGSNAVAPIRVEVDEAIYQAEKLL